MPRTSSAECPNILSAPGFHAVIFHCVSTLINTYPKTMASLFHAGVTDPIQVAEETLQRFTDWSRLKGMEMRPFEQDVGFFVLEQLTLGSPAASVLDDERAMEYPDMHQYTGMWPRTQKASARASR